MANAFLVLRKTKALLKTDGWTQGVAQNELGEHCLTGAVYEIDTPAAGDAINLLFRALKNREDDLFRKDLPEDGPEGYLQEYNDDEGREFSEILSLIDDAMNLEGELSG